MALTLGTRLGVYEVTAQIAEGGMGEVYRATDTNLKRQVAIKVLPTSVAGEADRLARFQREAEVLAALNHPNIAAIYGLEKTQDFTALVMELVEGEDLSQRIGRGAIPIDEALPIAKQIIDALEAAHEQGIVHRDLKPANVKLRPDGAVKVLDFGLAKALEPAATPGLTLTAAPTITTPAMTLAGMVLGTAAYMSPEQARGRAVDKRTDIWAFGCVLFEMLAGTRPFDGDDIAEALGAVIHKDVPWSKLPAATPATVRTVLERCLEKEPKQRIRDIGDVRLALSGGFGAQTPLAPSVAPKASSRRSVALATAAGLILGLAVAATVVLTSRRPAPAAIVTRFAIALPDGLTIPNGPRNILAIAPDGTSIAFATNGQLYLRSMRDAALSLVQGAQTAGAPFFSPDGRWLGYLSLDNKLRKIAVTGGAPVTIADFGAAAAIPFGPVWNADGFVYFGTRGAVERVSANGGRPEPAIRLNAGETAHRPQLLPDGDTLLFTVASGAVGPGPGAWDRSQIVVQSMKNGNRKAVITGGSDGRYLPTGHIVYTLGNTLFVVPFDLKTLVVGGAVPVVETVNRSAAFSAGGADAQLSIADNGSMIYVAGGSTNEDTIPTLVDEAGNQKPLPVPPGRRYAVPRFSPDGKRFAVQTTDDMGQDVWIGDLNDATPVRKLTFQGLNRTPVWAADGQSVAFSSDREGTGSFGIFRQRVDGGPAQRIGEPDQDVGPPQLESWSSDGTTLVFSSRVSGGSGAFSMFVLFPGTGKKPALVVRAAIGGLSSDGRWLTYGSTGSGPGQNQVYVEPFPQTGEKHQVSTDNGSQPLWSRDGKRLFFLKSGSGGRGRQLVAADVQTGRGLSFSGATPLPVPTIVTVGPRPYDVSPDGKTFLVILPKTQTGSERVGAGQINVTLNWFEELKQRVPTK